MKLLLGRCGNFSAALTAQARRALRSGLRREQLFTPLLNGERVVMKLSPEEKEWACRRGTGLRAEVTDLLSGRRYRVVGRSCGLPNCDCDAVGNRNP